MKTPLNSERIPSNTEVVISVKAEPSTTKESEKSKLQSSDLSNSCSNINKRPMSLDLKNTSKKRLATPAPLVIGSPETQNIKPLTTPDLEKLLHLLPTPQPGLIYQAKTTEVTSEQEAFGKGFEEALHSLRSNGNKQTQINNIGGLVNASSANVGNGMSGGSFTYTNLALFFNGRLLSRCQKFRLYVLEMGS